MAEAWRAWDWLSARHDKQAIVNPNDTAANNPKARGNVAFAGGHAEFTPRNVAHDPKSWDFYPR